jgi:hypothetical protein
MAEAKPFALAKLVVGLISSRDICFERAEEALKTLYGAVELKSPLFAFDLTDYYEKQMGKDLKRIFLSFVDLVPPEKLSSIKVQTNELEEKIRQGLGEKLRVVNIDPGILTTSALIMATAKDFSHRIPLAQGIYAHLEFLFAKNAIRILDWTYPDFKQEGYQKFFLDVRRTYLDQVKQLTKERP